jgi:hypothetical protein
VNLQQKGVGDASPRKMYKFIVQQKDKRALHTVAVYFHNLE